jgi:tRNA-splicing ligase RtcB
MWFPASPVRLQDTDFADVSQQARWPFCNRSSRLHCTPEVRHHGDRDLWVVRKGATPAFPGQRGFVGGSMGDDAVILSGIESPAAAASLYSTVHGAGRVMSRTEARGKRNRKTGEVISAGRVSHHEMHTWIRDRGVTLLGADLDEAPQAYRRLPDVLAHHAGTVKIEHTLRPFAVVMAGSEVNDPYKD